MLTHTPAPGLSHAGILACCSLVALCDDDLHDILVGATAVPTKPAPTHLVLSDVEQARGWLLQSEQRLKAVRERDGAIEEIAKAQSIVDLQYDRVRYWKRVEESDLWSGYKVAFEEHNRDRYAIVDKEGALLFYVPIDLPAKEVRFRLAFYCEARAAGVEQGRYEVRSGLFEVLGVPHLGRRRWME